ncbi:enoyl-(Acyl carrier protein) reductase domain-containing protein [Neofusicoccum parvum]|nr:enoyl-(Acyl carrier protein) reductase domain-containing protein [Neofusicoccum parvum]
MVGRLAGKNAIVTGAAGGVGLETTILMLQEGASVLMTDISAQALEKALAKVHSLGAEQTGKVDTIVADVSKEDDVARVLDAVDAWGGVDVMFNNAGIMHPADGDAEECPDAIWDLTMGINVKGVCIINTASMVALVGSATPQLAYTASKGAVLALTRELAIVHAREGFRFNSLCPAPLNTPMLQEFLGDDQEKRFRREVHFPSGRFGEAVEQAHAAVFLASDESSFVNATDFVVDGGLTKAYVTALGPPTAAPRNLAA